MFNIVFLLKHGTHFSFLIRLTPHTTEFEANLRALGFTHLMKCPLGACVKLLCFVNKEYNYKVKTSWPVKLYKLYYIKNIGPIYGAINKYLKKFVLKCLCRNYKFTKLAA